MTIRFVDPRPRLLDAQGNPIVGGKIYTYAAGTSTPLATYQDSALTVPAANPIITNSGGMTTTDIFLAAAQYRMVFEDASGVTIWTADPVDGALTDLSNVLLTATGTADAIILTSPFVASTYQQGQILRFLAIGTPSGAGVTVDWNGLGSRPVVRSDGSALPPYAWGAGETVELIYDGASFRTLRPSAMRVYAPFLLNGCFDVWQATTSLSIPASTTATASIYAADGWCMETSANQACTVSQQAGTGSARYRIRVQRNSGQTGTAVLRFQQPLEIWDVIRLRGKTVTVTALMKAGANFSGTIALKMLFGTGTEGRRTNAAPFTGETTPLSQALTLTASDAVVAGTSTAIAANATQGALVFEWTPSGTAGANDWFEVQEVWLDIAGASTPVVREPIQQTMARCQRFYWATPGPILFAVYYPAGGINLYGFVTLPVTMRAVPTVSGAFSAGTNNGATNVLGVSVSGFQISTPSVAAGVVGVTYNAGNTADARL